MSSSASLSKGWDFSLWAFGLQVDCDPPGSNNNISRGKVCAVDQCRYRCYVTLSAVYGAETDLQISSLNYLLHLFWKLIAIFLPDSPRQTTQRKMYQVVVAMFGAQHGGDLLQVGSVALLLHITGEGDWDDSLCDVDQIQLVVLLQGLQQTCTPIRKIGRETATVAVGSF